jgi:hypothetical protein
MSALSVQTREQARAAAGEARVLAFPSDREPPLMRQLLLAHENGELEPEPVALGPMPERPTKPMRDIAADMRLRLGLALAEGIERALMYATSEAVEAGFVSKRGSASYAIGRLCAAGVIRHVGDMPKLGKPYGTRLYVPPTWWPTDAEARAIVAETGRHDQAADLVWVPDATQELELGGAA